jgi:ATP-dependent Zn protease
MATAMALKYGMKGRLISMDDREIQMSQGKHDELIQSEINDALVRAQSLLETDDGKALMEAIAQELLENESLHEEDVDRIEVETLGKSYVVPKQESVSVTIEDGIVEEDVVSSEPAEVVS